MKKTTQIFISIAILIGLNSQLIKINAQVTSDSALVAYYPLNGNANDESGNEFHGTVLGPQPTSDHLNNQNSAYLFDGIDDVITTSPGIQGAFNISDNITIAAWVRIDDVNNSWQAIISNAEYAGYELGYYGNFSKKYYIDFHINNDNYKCFSINIPVQSEWVHLVGIYSHTPGNNGVIKLYLNGTLQDINSEGGDYSITNSTEVLSIGANPSAYKTIYRHFFNGAIDEVRIYNRVLDESEIEYLYTSVNNVIINSSVKIYPNPTTDYLSIDFDNKFSNSDIEIFDITGKKILGIKSRKNEEKINMSELDRGVYFIRIKNEEFIKTKKIIKH